MTTNSELARLLGLDSAEIGRAVKAGAPLSSVGEFVQAYIRWKVTAEAEESATTSHAKAQSRRAKAEARRVELENARNRGETVTAESVLAIDSAKHSEARGALLSIPSRISIALADETDPAVIRKTVHDEVALALKTYGIGESPDDKNQHRKASRWRSSRKPTRIPSHNNR